jgi:hypothetical protein
MAIDPPSAVQPDIDDIVSGVPNVQPRLRDRTNLAQSASSWFVPAEVKRLRRTDIRLNVL